MSGLDATKPLDVLGLMSGTSVDAVDACLVRLAYPDNGRLHHQILATHSLSIPEALRQRLLACMGNTTVRLDELIALDIEMGELFAATALGLIQANKIDSKSIACIGSHGQTIYHCPPGTLANQPLGGTLQIGEPAIIAERTGIYTIADFRPRDMAAGGHGAPLVCFADQLLFQDETKGRCVQNIGGIANVTVVPSCKASQSQENTSQKSVIAFDTGPGNMLMDAAMSHFYSQPYDDCGQIAESGKLDDGLLAHLLAHPYLALPPPKTTGREAFGIPYFQTLLAQFPPNLAPADWLCTLAHFTADSIAQAYARFVFPRYEISEVIIGGGGARNAYLLSLLRSAFQKQGQVIVIKTHADFGIPDQYKEALAFAILAWAALHREPNNLPTCTGATHPVVMGKHIPS